MPYRFTLTKLMLACAVTAGAWGLTGCGDSRQGHRAARLAEPALADVYSSLPLEGPANAEGQAVLAGMKLALANARERAGRWTVNFQSLDDAGATGTAWDAGKTAANARRVAADPRAVVYVGDAQADATAVSLPILNQVRMPQIVPAGGYVGLTHPGVGAASGDPGQYFPTGERTVFRLAPNDAEEAQVDMLAMHQAGCSRAAVIYDTSLAGRELVALLRSDQARYHVRVVAVAGSMSDLAPDAPEVAGQRAGCAFLAGAPVSGVAQALAGVRGALPNVKLFGNSGACAGLLPSTLLARPLSASDAVIECTMPAPGSATNPSYRAFLSAYRAEYGSSVPNPYVVYGYEAMELSLQLIRSLPARGDDRTAILSALKRLPARPSALGVYRFDREGDTTLSDYGVYAVAPSGNMALIRTVGPARLARRSGRAAGEDGRPLALGLEQPLVGRVQEGADRQAVGRKDGHAGADAQRLQAGGDALHRRLGSGGQLVGSAQGGLRSQQAELIAAHPRHRVLGADRPADGGGDLAQEVVAGGVAEAIVELLEAVHVEHDHAEGAAGAPVAGDLVLDPRHQRPAVGHAGEPVGQGRGAHGVALRFEPPARDEQDGRAHHRDEHGQRRRGERLPSGESASERRRHDEGRAGPGGPSGAPARRRQQRDRDAHPVGAGAAETGDAPRNHRGEDRRDQSANATGLRNLEHGRQFRFRTGRYGAAQATALGSG